MSTSGPAFSPVKLDSQLRPRYTARYCRPTLSVVILTLVFVDRHVRRMSGMPILSADIVDITHLEPGAALRLRTGI